MPEKPRKPVAPYKAKKGEAYMNPKQLDHFRGLGCAVQESDMGLELRNRDRERKLIKKINEMLAKIDAGEYGYCENCGVEIGLNRLEARPTATLCIDCKTLDEIREKQVAK